jgi:hypothetical protein
MITMKDVIREGNPLLKEKSVDVQQLLTDMVTQGNLEAEDLAPAQFKRWMW